MPNIPEVTSTSNSTEIIQKNTFGVFFQIDYHPDTQKYSISDMGNGYGTFIQLSSSLIIKENSLINIGDSYLVFSFQEENNLMLKMYSGNYQYEPMYLQSEEGKIITIGREEKCDICLNDKMLSRVHCVLIYDKENGLSITDGNGQENGSKSMNGTWVFAFENVEIIDGMIFKSNSNLFSCHYIFE